MESKVEEYGTHGWDVADGGMGGIGGATVEKRATLLQNNSTAFYLHG